MGLSKHLEFLKARGRLHRNNHQTPSTPRHPVTALAQAELFVRVERLFAPKQTPNETCAHATHVEVFR